MKLSSDAHNPSIRSGARSPSDAHNKPSSIVPQQDTQQVPLHRPHSGGGTEGASAAGGGGGGGGAGGGDSGSVSTSSMLPLGILVPAGRTTL
jgi:hypothetical protein